MSGIPLVHGGIPVDIWSRADEIAYVEPASDRMARICHALVAERETAQAELTQARTRIAELEKALEWQPIETAPKDGTEILLFGPGVLFVDGRTALYAKARHVGWWGHLGSEGVWLTRDPSVTCRATRWRPLPATPIDGGKG